MSWYKAINDFKNYLLIERSLSKNSVDSYLRDVKKLAKFCTPLNISETQVKTDDIRSFIKHANTYNISSRTQARMISGIKSFYRFLILEDFIKYTLKEYEKKFGWVKDKEILDCIEEKEEKMKQKINIQDQENYSTIFFILEEDYMNNYNKKDLELIADYYGISKRKKKKQDLVQDIIIFEQDYMNEEVRMGLILREEAILLNEKYDGKCSEESIKKFCDFIDITLDEFWYSQDQRNHKIT